MPGVWVEHEDVPRVAARPPEPEPPARRDAALAVNAVRAMQRGAGNAAVARLLQRQTVDAMIEAARRREPEPDEDEDDEAWAVGPPEPYEGPEADETEEVEAEDEAEAEAEPAGPSTPSPMAGPSLAVPELGGVLHAGQRSFATGMPQEEVVAEAQATRAQALSWFKRPDAQAEVGTRPQWGARRKKRLEKAIGGQAAHLKGGGAADSGVQAESILGKRKADAEALKERRAKEEAERKKRATDVERLQQLHPAGKKQPDEAAVGHVKIRAAEEDAHKKLVANDQLEAAGYGDLRQRGYALRSRIEAASPFVQREVKPALATVQRIVTAAPHSRLVETSSQLDVAEKAVTAALAAEQDFRFVREKAAAILARINSAGAAFKDRISQKSRDTANEYATGAPVAKKQHQAAYIALKEAESDLDAREKEWEIAKRSHDKLATLKARRATLAYIDAQADHVIAVSDGQDLALDFWGLQESVKDVEAAVARLDALEKGFNGITARLNFVLARGPVDPGDNATLTNGVAGRTLDPRPDRLLSDLHDVMRRVERPAIDTEFNTPRNHANYNIATAGLSALVSAGVVRRGELNSVYTTSYDGSGFSAEFIIDGLPEVVIHVHCTKDGYPKDGENAAHWKPKSVKYSPGVSHAIPNALRDRLIDRDKIAASKDFDRSKS